MLTQDEKYMAMAIDLALMGKGRTSPNPMVGAVVVKDGKVVGSGYHKKAGTPHAEAIALQAAGADAKGATLFVNLEPCCHTRKLTPPCTDAVITSGVARVVIGMMDPNPEVSGRGVSLLRDAGLTVDVGVLRERCEDINVVFRKYITTGLPFVTLKAAQTLDGKIATATGESKWITGPEAREYGHTLRNLADAIVVGIGTVLKDDPSLTTRLGTQDSRDPARIILDSHARIPLTAKVLNLESGAKTYVAVTSGAPEDRIKELKAKGAEVLVIGAKDGRVDIEALMRELANMGMTNVLVEGGATVNADALRAGIVDKVNFFIAPKILGGEDAIGSIGGRSPESLTGAVQLYDMSFTKLGGDILVEANCAPTKQES
jgi:diaminohydroxyphosphoribosylaminopyrimidine deaminase / 5-amino-6-(5-phosphoribosylamino)uracil reductase